MCVTETHLDTDEDIEIEGYEIYYNNCVKGKGGILIAVKDNLKGITIETENITEEYQTLWIKIDNNRHKINIGSVYAPQESRNNIKIFKNMYQKINNKINTAKQDKEKIYI